MAIPCNGYFETMAVRNECGSTFETNMHRALDSVGTHLPTTLIFIIAPNSAILS